MNSAANDVDAMSVKELKALITKAGLSHADCFEKSDLRQRAREALAKTAAAEEEESEEDEIEDSDDEMDESTQENAEVPTADSLAHLIPNVDQMRDLDCEGQCKGKRTKHRVFVYEYEASKALIVHVQCPKSMPLCHIERTLFASEGEEENSAAFDLQAMVCRVGMSHYVCYRRECAQ